jgi:hypothetical protein
MRLDTRPLANHNTFLDFNERADETIVADGAFVEIDGFNNDNSGAKVDVSDLGLTNVGAIHEDLLLISTAPTSGLSRVMHEDNAPPPSIID